MTNPLEYFLHWETTVPDDLFLRQPRGNQWNTWTFRQAGDEIRRVAHYLRGLKLPPHSHVAILSKNCAHWIMTDLAIMMSGHVSVPLYPTLTADSIREILEHSESKIIFIGKLDQYETQKIGIRSIRSIGTDVYGVPGDISWEQITAYHTPVESVQTLKPDDLMTIVYTSGTTGKPKGVMHAYKSFHATLTGAKEELNFPMRPKLFSYLPLSHIAERIGIETMGLMLGAEFSFSESLETFPRNLADTQPDYFFAVPRIWAKFQEKILQKIPEPKFSILMSIPVVGALLKRSIRKKLGLSKAKLFFSGAAPLSVSQLLWWNKIGVLIRSGY